VPYEVVDQRYRVMRHEVDAVSKFEGVGSSPMGQ
jgi:hypothetical protein